MSWADLIRHPYITTDPRQEQKEDQMHLSYSLEHGQYVAEEIAQSFIINHKNPQGLFNERNAIMLNCKDPRLFKQVYEKAIEKHF